MDSSAPRSKHLINGSRSDLGPSSRIPGQATVGLLLSALLLISGCDGCSSQTTACGTCAEGLFCCYQTAACEPITYNCTNIERCGRGTVLDYGAGPFMDPQSCAPLPLQCSCREVTEVQPQFLGRFSGLTAHGDQLMASGYESGLGDLVFFSASTSSLQTIQRQIIDGVPDVQPTMDAQGWRGGVVEPGDDVGLHTDILVGAGGQPMISYMDRSNRALKFAQRADETWTTHTVAFAKGWKESLGLHTALLITRGDKPAIAFLAINVEREPGTYVSEVRWASALTSSPRSTDDWTITVVDSQPMPCAGLCPQGQTCILAADGSSSCVQEGTACAGCLEGQVCTSGGCRDALVELSFQDTPQASGLWLSAVMAAQGPRVLYYDRFKGRLMGARLEGPKWIPAVLHQMPPSKVGAFCALSIDDWNNLHVAYQDATQLTLLYLKANADSLTVMEQEIIDDGKRLDGVHPVGADPAIISKEGALWVIYQDMQTGDLLLSKRIDTNSWTPNDPKDKDLGRLLKGGPQGFGFYSDMLIHSGAVYGSTYVLDPLSVIMGDLELFSVE